MSVLFELRSLISYVCNIELRVLFQLSSLLSYSSFSPFAQLITISDRAAPCWDCIKLSVKQKYTFRSELVFSLAWNHWQNRIGPLL
jgi:hypothetical protein